MLLKRKNQADYSKKMGAANAERGRRRDAINEENRQKVLQELQQFKPETRQQEQDVAQTEIQDRVTTDLLKAVQEGESAKVTTSGGKAMLQDRAARTRASADKASTLAALLSRYRAPMQAERGEARKSSGFALDRRGISARGRRQDINDRNWLNAIRPDPMKEILGSAMMAYGAAGAGGAEAGGASALSGFGARGTTVSGDAFQPARDIFKYGT